MPEVVGSQTLEANATGFVWTNGFQIINGRYQFLDPAFDNDGRMRPSRMRSTTAASSSARPRSRAARWQIDWTPISLFDFATLSSGPNLSMLPVQANP